MKEKIKSLRLNITISALISVLIGVLLIIFPTQSLNTIGKVIAVIIIFSGISVIISQIYESGVNVMGIVVGAVIALVGIWMFNSPSGIISIIPIAIGVLLVAHGIQDLKLAIEATRAKADRPWIPYLISVLNIVLGIICIAGAFNILKIATQLIGFMLIFDGISDIGIVHKVRKATGTVIDSTIVSEEDIDF